MPLFAAFVALFFTRGAKEEYKSTTQLSTGFTITDQVSITEGKFNLYEIEVKFSNLIETLKSPLVMNILGYELLLRDLQSDDPYRKLTKDDYKNNLFLSDLDLSDAERILETKIDSLVLLDTYIPTEKRILKLLQLYKYHPKALKEILTIKRVNRTDYISITAVTSNANFSAYIVNKLYDVYKRYNASEESIRTIESVQKWKVLVDQKKSDLDSKTEELRRFKSRHNLLNFEVETTSKIEQLSNLESDLDDENRKYRRLLLEINDTESKLAALESGEGVSVGVSNSEILELRNQINDLNSRYEASGRTDYEIGDSLRLLRTRLQNYASLSSQSSDRDKKESLNTILSDLKIQQDLTDQNITSINENIRQIRRSIGGYAGYEARVATLEKEVQLASTEYLWAQEKYNQAVDLATASTSTVRQVVKGQPSTKPEPSKRLITTALAGVATFILCFVVVILLEYMDTSIKSPSNFEKEVGLKLLGSVNKMPPVSPNGKTENYKYFDLNTENKIGTEKKLIPRLKNKVKKYLVEKIPYTKKFIILEEANYDLFNDQIRKIRFELSNFEKNILLFTSTKKGEGKTEMIVSLAESLSIREKKILLVDTNFNHNSITRYYDAEPILGTDKKTKSGHDVIEDMISQTDNPNIDIIGCQAGNFSPFEILPKQDFFSQVHGLLDRYDFIFIEGPAINYYSDTKELSGLANGVISIFSANSVIKQIDKESVSFLKELNGKFIGSILNKVEQNNINQ